ncbi:MAG: hypothetical protein LBB36_06250, partial [Fibromonadaceae bacterium]|nr:hypothetical protein [Fibromonadaceae bacterium]
DSSSSIASSSSQQQSSSGTGSSEGSFVYEGQTYKTVKIGTQTWMAENLNYAVDGSKCYNNLESNCNDKKYGRLYDWSTAMGFKTACNSYLISNANCGETIGVPHKGICPSGWHIPTNADWDALYRYADGTSGTSSPYESPTAGKHLKAEEGWTSCSASGSSYSCLDTHGFAALPGGYGYSDGSFDNAGNYGGWWSASEYNANYAYSRSMRYNAEGAYWNYNYKSGLQSVRCLQD